MPPALQTYIGRFAPSPTGPLHFGSLLTALSSFLEAKRNDGQWLVRMEDLDPPREQPGAAQQILRSLEAHQLHWHGQICYQSQRHSLYDDYLERLLQQQLAYPCSCTRQQLQAMGGIYSGHCRRHPPGATAPSAMRLVTTPSNDNPQSSSIHFDDQFQGPQQQDIAQQVGDFIIKRKDRLFAYQLAVVIDDIEQQVSHIVRGSDLLDSSPRQIFLFHQLQQAPPAFGHIPLALNPQGQKLSKQNHAPALEDDRAGENLWRALDFLQQQPPVELRGEPPAVLLDWATGHWHPNRIPASLSITFTP